MRARLFVLALAAMGCGSQASGPAVVFDPCAPAIVAAPDGTAEQLASIDDAIALWHAEGVTQLARGDGAQIGIVFRDAAPAMYGFYDDTTATIYINLRLDDPAQRAITIAHELGHAFALVHIPASERASVMNPGNLVIAPDDGDAAALASKWGSCTP